MTHYEYAVRVTLQLYGLTARESFLVAATCDEVAMLLAGVTLGQSILVTGLQYEIDDIAALGEPGFRVRLIELACAGEVTL